MSPEVKQCRWCGDDFKQQKPPKSTQTYCRWVCYLAASADGVL